MTRCESCPVPRGQLCPSEATGHLRFCEWALRPGPRRDYVAANGVMRVAYEAAIVAALALEGAELHAAREAGIPDHGLVTVAGGVDARTVYLLRRVKNCPDRGSALPVSQQPECGCYELTACRAMKGTVPGRVTLRDCMACREASPGDAGPGPAPRGGASLGEATPDLVRLDLVEPGLAGRALGPGPGPD